MRQHAMCGGTSDNLLQKTAVTTTAAAVATKTTAMAADRPAQFYFHRSEEESSESGDDDDVTWTAATFPSINPFKDLRRRVSSVWPARLNDKQIFVSRHGESEYNVLDKIGGNPPLSPRGTLYAKALGRYFNTQEKSNLVIWTSTLQRTAQTAAFVRATERHKFPELDEIKSGKLDGLSYSEFEDQYPDDFREREKDKLGYRYPGGESYVDCCERVVPFLEKFEEECRLGSSTPLLIVAHQAILRCVLGYLLDTDMIEIPFVKIPQHTIMQLRWTDTTDLDGMPVDVNQDCVVEYVRLPIDHAEQGVVSSALSM